MTYYFVSAFPQIFIETVIVHNGKLVFGSFIGRDATLQQLRGQLSMPTDVRGWSLLRAVNEDQATKAEFELLSNVEMQSTRLETSQHGQMVQCFFYDPLCNQPSQVDGRGIILSMCDNKGVVLDNDLYKARLWELVKSTSDVPLIDSWRDEIISYITDECDGVVVVCDALHSSVPTSCTATAVYMKEANLEQFISRGIKTGHLAINNLADVA